MNLEQNINQVRERIEAACRRCGRNPDEITLIGVTKTKPVELINESIDKYGIKVIGENKVQEVMQKYDDLSKNAEIHLIGHLQTNKVKYIIDKVDMIHSVDSEHLADEISRRAVKCGVVMNTLVQVNVSGEESKSGVSVEKLDALLDHISTLPGIKVSGLMTIAPIFDGNIENTRKVFKTLYKIFLDKKQKKYDNIIMENLSMGMSGDFECAIEEGATMVRVGRTIYGDRDYGII